MACKTRFQSEWLKDPKFKSWLEAVKDSPFRASCRLCRYSFSLSNMGRRAVSSHAEGSKHKIAAKNSGAITNYFSSPVDAKPQFNNPEPSTSQPVATDDGNDSSLLRRNSRVNDFLIKEDSTRAEILWCIQVVMNHRTMRSAARDVGVFKRMFSDSEIATKIQLQKDKMGYVIVHGIAPYFKTILFHEIELADVITVGFDESLNKVSQMQQMDIDIHYWDNSKDEVVVRYWSSAFLGHTTASDLLAAFNKEIPPHFMKKVINISMDGPNVNFKFLRDFKASIKEIEGPVLLEVGSCGLHTMHCAYKAGFQETGWMLVKFLRALFNLFKNVPARRADYRRLTNSSIFPLKFSAVRWLECANVAQRAIEILPNVKVYVRGIEQGNSAPSCMSFGEVKKALQDSLLAPKLAFFRTVASDLEPFMTEFQCNRPMIPFLYSALCGALRIIMDRFVKKEVLEEASNPSCINVTQNENLLPVKHVKVGYATMAELKKVKKLKELDVMTFKRDCRECLVKICQKLVTRSPLSYKFTKAVSCFDPQLVSSSKSLAESRLQTLLSILVENKWIDGPTADQAAREFSNFVSQPSASDRLKSFDRLSDRADHFWRDFFGRSSPELRILKVMKMVLVISHGNSSLERGFSVNKEDLIDNMANETLVARRLVYDSVKTIVGPNVQDLVIDKSLIHSTKNARSRYMEEISRKKAEDEERQLKLKKKRQVELQIMELEAKRAKLREEKDKELELLEENIKKLAEESNK